MVLSELVWVDDVMRHAIVDEGRMEAIIDNRGKPVKEGMSFSSRSLEGTIYSVTKDATGNQRVLIRPGGVNCEPQNVESC